MSMTKMECFIYRFQHIYETELYQGADAYAYEILECLSDLDKSLEILYEYQDEINSRKVDELLRKYYE